MTDGTHYSTGEMLERLVAFDTVSNRSNRALIDFVVDYLAGHGIASQLIESEDGAKANLFATLGEARPGGVALSGHTDVVPVEGQDWSSDPFQLRSAGGRLYGRGSCDMKGFIAVVLARVPGVDPAHLTRPLHIVLSYDEEIGCVGVRPMVEAIGRSLPTPDVVIVGEPTGMKVVHAHKGFFGCRTTIRGRAAHSSLPDLGSSAIVLASQLIGGLTEIMAEIQAGTAPDSPFSPPHTTFNVGRIDGGNAINIIPEQCVFEWECRPVSRRDAAAIPKRFAALAAVIEAEEQARIPEVSIRTVTMASVPPCERETDGAAETLVKSLLGTNESHAVSFGTEAALFQERGMSVAICGPGHIDQAHQPDEYVALDQLAQCEAFVDKLFAWAAG